MEEPCEKKRLTFKKAERLHHRTLVEGLFHEGRSISEFPLRLKWRAVGKDKLEKSFRNRVPEKISQVQMMITVPKKMRKYAVDRVLMRRRIREAYRINRLTLLKEVAKNNGIATLSLAFIYMHNENLPYNIIERKMKSLQCKLTEKIKKNRGSECQDF